MADQLSDKERRTRLARTVELATMGPVEADLRAFASAAVATFDEAVNAVIAKLEHTSGRSGSFDDRPFKSNVRTRMGEVMARVVAGFASEVLGVDVFDERKWRKIGETPEAVRDATYGITERAYSEIVDEHIEYLCRVWSADLRRDVSKIVAEAASGRISVGDASGRLQDELGMDEDRANAVSRTEVYAAWNHAEWRSVLAWRERGDELEWRAEMDGRTRETHAKADGQRVKVGRPFSVGGHDARFAGDPRLPVGERVQCRCRLVLVSR